MNQNDEKVKNINDKSNIRFVDSKNAKSILTSKLMETKKQNINQLQEAVDKLDEIKEVADKLNDVPVTEEKPKELEVVEEPKEVIDEPDKIIINVGEASEVEPPLNNTQEVEILDENFLNEDIAPETMQAFLSANNYASFEEPIPEVPIPLEQEFEIKRVNPIVAFFSRVPSKVRLAFAGVIAILIVVLGIVFTKYQIKIHTYNILINGEEKVILYEGGLYKENGAVVYNYKNEDKTDLLKIKAKVDTEKVGNYTVTYSVNSLWKKNSATREVSILPNPLDDIYFSLKGEDVVSLKINTKFVDPGYNIKSKDNVDYSKYVTVTNNINNKKIGTYEVRYLFKINKKQQELVRTVKVIGSTYSINFDKTPTKGNVVAKISSNISDFAYFMVDGKKVTKDSFTYTVKQNGQFNFEMYNTKGKMEKIALVVNNIDRTPPSGSCVATMSSKSNVTSFNLNLKDNSQVVSYIYNNYAYTTSTFTVNSLVKSGSVQVVDQAGNRSTISCDYIYSPITSTSVNNVIKRFDGDTMKYWIEKPTNTYIITHIWVQDPYNQFKVAIPKKFPSLEKASKIMSIANEKYGYYSKAMIGANASGFVSNSFNVAIARKYPKWKYSSKSPLVIIDGKVLRNYTNLKQVGGAGTLTYGLRKTGYFASYYLNSPTDKKGNQRNAKMAINDGVKYTFAFGPYLVRSGELHKGLSNIPDVRQAIGQIDKNNFVIVTNTVGINNRISGLSLKRLASIMYSLGCREAYNIDGGGSTNLMYKNRNTNTINGIVTKNRDVADVLYFVEK